MNYLIEVVSGCSNKLLNLLSIKLLFLFNNLGILVFILVPFPAAKISTSKLFIYLIKSLFFLRDLHFSLKILIFSQLSFYN